ncbi:MAG: hypothetical protein OCD02_08495 [Spirochaetaceae bacterium]
MILTKDNLIFLQKKAEIAVIKAGEIITEYKKKGFKVNTKIAGSSIASQVVTEVDILCQETILDVLNETIVHFDLGLLTEELADDSSRLIKDYFWCLDPLDGTQCFIEKEYGFSVSIALVNKQGGALIGVVLDPVKNDLYSALKGEGLYKNNKPWSPIIKTDNTIKNIIVDPSFKIKDYKNIKFMQYGGAVLNAIQVLEGKADCYLKLPKNSLGGGSIWDFAATVAIFNECNAISSDIAGNQIFLNNPNTTFMNGTGVFYSLGTNISNLQFIK